MMRIFTILLIVSCIVFANAQLPTKIKLCRSRTFYGDPNTVSPMSALFKEQGWLYWQRWMAERGGFIIDGVKHELEVVTYEDAGELDNAKLFYGKVKLIISLIMRITRKLLLERFLSGTEGCHLLGGPWLSSNAIVTFQMNNQSAV